jgi:hypothetical protein
VARQVRPQIQKERGDVVAATRVAGPQPQLRHQPRLGQHRQQRMQTGFDSLFGVTARHPFLLAVLVQQPCGIQIQRVTFLVAGEPVQTPLPKWTKAAQVVSRRGESLEKARQHRLAGDARDAQKFRRERIAPQIRDVGELARVTEQPVHEGQRLFDRQQFVVGPRQRLRQHSGQTLTPSLRTQPAPEHGAARVRGKLLIGEADGDCLAVGFELQCPGHRLVIRACARRLRCFHLPPINPQSVARFQLHGFG